MGIPYSAIIGPVGSRKRVRYEDDDSETLQPARRLQRRNAMRELRHAHGETVPLLIRSLNLGNSTTSRGYQTPRLPYVQPGDSRERSHSASSSALTNPVTDDEIRLLEEHYTHVRSNLSDRPLFAAGERQANTGDSVDDDLLNLRHALWQSAGIPPEPPSSAPSLSPRSRVQQMIAPPSLTYARRGLFSSSTRPFIAPRPTSNGPSSERVRRVDAHSSIDGRGLNFDRVLGQQGLRPYTNFESRVRNGRTLGGGNPNRHAIVVENPDPDYNVNDMNTTIGDELVNGTDATNRDIQEDRLRQTGAVASMRAARVSSMAALLAMSLEGRRRGVIIDTGEELRNGGSSSEETTDFFTNLVRRRQRRERREALGNNHNEEEEEEGRQGEQSTFMLPLTAVQTTNRPRLEETTVPQGDDENMEEAPEESNTRVQ